MVLHAEEVVDEAEAPLSLSLEEDCLVVVDCCGEVIENYGGILTNEEQVAEYDEGVDDVGRDEG